MNRFENLQINERPVLLALLHYEDHFYDTALRQYDFKEALYLYLKRNGYDTIIFFSINKGIHSFEEGMLASFLNVQGKQSRVQPKQSIMPRVGRGTGRFDLQSHSLCDNQKKDALVYQDKDGIWADKRSTSRDAQMKQIIFNLLNREHCVVIVEPSYGSSEFKREQIEYLNEVIACLGNEKLKRNHNHFILLANTTITAENDVPANIDPSVRGDDHIKSGFWNSPFFLSYFLISSKDEKGILHYSLKDMDKSFGPVWVLPSPTADDCKNAFQYWRIVNGSVRNVKWTEVKDIMEQLSISRGSNGKNRTNSLNQWGYYFNTSEEISIDAFESFGVHRVDNSKIIRFNKDRLEHDLQHIKGQQDSVEIIVAAITTWIRKKKKNKPLVFMFAGTSGTGKTYTAKTIQGALAEDGYKFVRLSMNEYHTEADSWKLLGSAPGYAGSGTDAPLFAHRKMSDKLVILFDEIEKAHPSLFTTIMSLMDEGLLADGRGVNYDFRQSIIIFTTNLACDRLLEAKKSLNAAGYEITSNKFQDTAKKILNDNKMPNEICGRINWLLIYNALSASDIVQIAVEQIRAKGRKYDLNINLVSKVYLREIAEQYSGSNEGARPVQTEIDEKIKPLFQDAYESGLLSSDRLYDITDNMRIVESESNEIIENIDVDIEPPKTIRFNKDRLEHDLQHIKGQQDSVEIIVAAITTWIRKKKKNKPLVFMFAGTSGTGKTYTAKTIQGALAEDGYKFVRLSMNEYHTEADSWKLLGSAPGYAGSGTDAPLFAHRKMSDKLVILFDEIEKAHPSLFTTIMSLMDEGLLADGRGVNYDFRQSIIIFTTNLACDRLLEAKKSLNAAGYEITSNKFQDTAKKILNDNKMPNEICGRINWLLIYNALSASDIVQIAVEQIRAKGRKYDLNINLVSKVYLREIAEQYSGSNEGARPVQTEIDTKIESLFQDAYESGLLSSDKLYDIDDDMQIIESKSTEFEELIPIC